MVNSIRSCYFLLLCFIYFSTVSSQQQLKGKIVDDDSIPIDGVLVVLKKITTEPVILSYTTSDGNGDFQIELSENFDNSYLEFSSLGFEKQKISLEENFSLVTLVPTSIELKEVYITADKPILERKKDTINFDLTKVVDGTEDVIEDVLKKLPGIEIEDNGLIKFEGQRVSHILLDSDNLFNYGEYSIGTKNIDAEVIGGVEAIKNYTENEVLRGFKKNGQLALNIRLKQKAGDFSGDIHSSYGIKNRFDERINGLWVSKLFKNFSFINFNNIGKPKFTSLFKNLDGENGLNTYASPDPLISTNLFGVSLPEERSKLNNDLYSSVNNIIKVNEKLILNVNLGYTKERVHQNSNTTTNYLPSLNIVTIQESLNQNLNSDLGNFKLRSVFLPSKRSRIAFDTQINDNSILGRQEINLNDSLQKTETGTKIWSHFNQLTYTNRFNSSWVLNSAFSIQEASNSQSFEFRNFSNGLISNQILNVNSKSSKLSSNLIYNFNDFNFDIKISYEALSRKLNSLLLNDLFAENSVFYKLKLIEISKRINWSFDKLDMKLFLDSFYLEQGLMDNEFKSNNDLLFSPNFQMRYGFSPTSSLNFKIGADKELLKEKYLFENNIQYSNRLYIRNNPSLEPILPFKSNIQYVLNDQFNSFLVNLDFGLIFRNRNFIPFSSFDNTNNFITYNFLDSKSRSYTLSALVSKYIDFFKSNFRFAWVSNVNEFQNVVNESGLLDNRNYNNIFTVGVKTGFLKHINFENIFEINTSYFTNNISSFNNTSFNNSFKIYYTNDNLKIESSLDYIKLGNDNVNGIFFIDTSCLYSNKKNTIDYELSFKNNNFSNSLISEVIIGDLSTTRRQIGIQKPYILFKMMFKL